MSALQELSDANAYQRVHGLFTDLDYSKFTVVIDDRCTACGACISTCPTTALLPAPLRPSVVDNRCTGCLECVEICPRGAISEVTR